MSEHPALSFAQERLWFVHQLQPGLNAFHVSASRLLNLTDPAAVERALNAVLARHDILRASFPSHDGKPRQAIAPVRDIELSDSPASGLENGPLFRARLSRSEPGRLTLLLVAHRMVADLHSLHLIFEEVERGPQPTAPAYEEFVNAQREWITSAAYAEAMDFWRGQHANRSHIFELRPDHPRPAAQSFRVATEPLDLPQEEWEGVTREELLLTGVAALLHRHSTQDEVAIGVMDESWRAQYPHTVGCFENLLPLRFDFTGPPTFRQLLSQTRDRLSAARKVALAPFEKIIEELQVERDFSRAPLVQIAFRADLATGTPEFDLLFSSTGLQYDTALFEAATIRRLAGHLKNLLASAASEPDIPISRLALLSNRERDQLLREWNATQCDYPVGVCAHELFERQAALTPDAVAAEFGAATLIYGEINRQANQLAHYLIAQGARPELCIGIALERSLRMLVAVLAVLKAGVAYVPLDPSYPAERLAFIISDSRLALRITEDWLDSAAGEIARQPDTNPVSGVTAENPAYVIYTSGSTGRPKGVQVTHRGIGNMVLAQIRAFGLNASDRVLQFASLNFDASVYETFIALLSGARLVLARPEALLPGEPLAQTLREHAITVLVIPPSLLSVMNPAEVPLIRVLVVAGEACPAELVDRWAPSRRMFNAYGPTENTVCATLYECSAGKGAPPIGRPIANTRIYILNPELQPAPIGVPGEIHMGSPGLARGYANQPELTAQKFIDDPFVPGERLYKSGDLGTWLADGNIQFLGRIDHQIKLRGFRIEQGEIEAVLLKHPAVAQAVVLAREDRPGDTKLVAYVTGRARQPVDIDDLRSHAARYLPDYMLPAAFVHLAAMPLSPSGKVDRNALPVPGRERAGMGQDYVEPATPLEKSIAAIWGELLNLDTVGRSDNFFRIGGHSLLATQALSRLRQEFELDIPLRTLFETPTVSGLAGAILETLAGPARGPVGEFQRRLQNLPPEKRALLERTLLNQHAAARPAKAIPRRATTGPAPLSFAQQRLWFLDQWEPGAPTYNAALGLVLRGPLNTDALAKTFDSIVERHEIFRTTYHLVDGYPMQMVQPARTAGTRFVDARRLPKDKRQPAIDRLIREECRRPFHLAKHLMLRTTIVRAADDEHILLIVAHHIACDGWTRGLLFHEISQWYAFHAQGTPVSLPPLSIQFADYAAWQRATFEGPAMEAQWSYWSSRLDGCPAHINLPLDHPRPPRQVYSGAHYFFDLPADTAAALTALTRQEGATLFITCLAAFNVLLCALSGQDDILVGTPIANRGRLEFEPLMGFFANTVVMRLKLDGDPDFRALVSRAKETALGAYSHQDMPFEKLVENLRLPRDLSRNPLFQVNFRTRTSAGPELLLPGLEVRHLDLDIGTSKFDLALELCAHPDGINGFFEYNTALFEPATIEGITEEWKRLAGELALHPTTPVAALSSFQNLRQLASRSTARARTFSRGRKPVELAGPGGRTA